jgi:hypothetical protein
MTCYIVSHRNWFFPFARCDVSIIDIPSVVHHKEVTYILGKIVVSNNYGINVIIIFLSINLCLAECGKKRI